MTWDYRIRQKIALAREANDIAVEARAARLDRIFCELERRRNRPADHASRIIALADAPAIVDHELD